MGKFVRELAQLPDNRQKAIREGLQNQIIAQAVFIRDEQPTRFLDYIDGEIKDADASMLKMVQESNREGAELEAISEIYIWNKERKKALDRLRDEVQPIEPLQKPTEPLQGYTEVLQASPEPQQETQQIKSNRGRPNKPFKELMKDDADGCRLQKIHTLMKGQKGKGAALIILACIKIGWISQPTYTQVKNEFGDIGVQQGFTRYLKESMFSKEEIEGAINSLK